MSGGTVSTRPTYSVETQRAIDNMSDLWIARHDEVASTAAAASGSAVVSRGDVLVASADILQRDHGPQLVESGLPTQVASLVRSGAVEQAERIVHDAQRRVLGAVRDRVVLGKIAKALPDDLVVDAGGISVASSGALSVAVRPRTGSGVMHVEVGARGPDESVEVLFKPSGLCEKDGASHQQVCDRELELVAEIGKALKLDGVDLGEMMRHGRKVKPPAESRKKEVLKSRRKA